jgi:hypothetical protein
MSMVVFIPSAIFIATIIQHRLRGAKHAAGKTVRAPAFIVAVCSGRARACSYG